MASNGEKDSISELVSRLIDDAEGFVRAEIRLYRAQLFARIDRAKVGIALMIGAVSLVQAAIVALLVGLVGTLRAPLGVFGATAAVVVGAIVIAGILAKVAFGKLQAATKLEDDNE